MTQIKKVEIHEFTHSVKNLGLLTNANTIGAVGYAKGQITKMDKYAIVVETDDGCRGEYVTHWGGNQAACAQSKMLAPKLLEYNAEEREKIYDDFKREFLNSKDQPAVLKDNFWPNYDANDYSIYWMKYDKLPCEGKILFRTCNSMSFFLQKLNILTNST